MAVNLVWFRKDLRVNDNLALHHACQDAQAQVIALYIATPGQWKRHVLSERQAGWIEQHLVQLQQQLAELNIPLLFRQVEDFNQAAQMVISLCRQLNVSGLFYNRQYEWDEKLRDQSLETQLPCFSYDDSVLLPPQQVVNRQGQHYQVFTPYRRAFIQQFQTVAGKLYPPPAKRSMIKTPIPVSTTINTIKLNYSTKMQTHFLVGEHAALRRLEQFCQQSVTHYPQQRNFPAIAGTSQLSPYLACGILSVRQCVNQLYLSHADFCEQSESGEFTWFSELIWREFYHYLIDKYPRLSQHQPYHAWEKRILWQDNDQNLRAWQQGLTGFPIVDAAMRQLNALGWMHNRLRMIVASFLVKNLFIDWRIGERYFMQQLIDGDLAANNGGWQWAASCGTDAVPYFRIFNSTTQGKRFDPNGKFIRQWVPELENVPLRALHAPHKWLLEQGRKTDYPAPIVDHQQTRARALSIFRQAIKPK